jgi:hypothetical protein
MSIKAMVYYLDNSKQTANAKLALIILADYADDEGECFPGVGRIAHRLGMKKRGAQSILSKLQEAGEIEILYNQGLHTTTGSTNRYRLLKYIQHIKQSPIETNDDDCEDAQGVHGDAPLDNAQGVHGNAQGVHGNAQGVHGDASDPSVTDPLDLDPSEEDRVTCNSLVHTSSFPPLFRTSKASICPDCPFRLNGARKLRQMTSQRPSKLWV